MTPEAQDMVYRASSNPEDSCRSPCKCYVLASHYVREDDQLNTREEVAYPASSSTNGEPELLNEKDRISKHPRATETGASATDFWRVTAACLKTDDDGNPKVAIAFQLELPEGEYYAARAELVRRFGEASLTELPRRPPSRRAKRPPKRSASRGRRRTKPR